jgi:thiamine biosynthesis lipoprotein
MNYLQLKENLKHIRQGKNKNNFIKGLQKFSLLIVYLFIFISCQNKNNYIVLEGYTQGSTYRIIYNSPLQINYSKEVDSLLITIDNSLSIFNPNSTLSIINSNKEAFADYHLKKVFEISELIYKKTNKVFDITVGPLVNLWGFGPNQKQEIKKERIDSALRLIGFEKVKIIDDKIIKTDKNIKLDFNAIAQGYTVDLIADFFESKNISDYLVEVGGEVRTKGKNSKGVYWRIGIDKPLDNNNQPGKNIQTIVYLNNKSLATSGNYRKFYIEDGIKYSHIINPSTGYPAKNNLLSVSVVADKCAIADAYATAFMVMGIEKSLEFIKKEKSLEAYFIYSDENGKFKVKFTDGFKKMLTN